MKTKRFLTAAVLAALTILLGGAALRGKTASGQIAHAEVSPETAAAPREGDYIWDSVDRYWERDRSGQRDQ